MKLYIAGPMRGRLLHNFPMFFKAARILREYGFEVISPAEMDMESGFNPGLPLDQQTNGFDLHQTLANDVRAVLDADGIVLLPGWERSDGARLELHVARSTGKAVFVMSQTGDYRDATDEVLPDEVRRLWASLPGVKALRLTTVGDGIDDDVDIAMRVDIIDTETQELVYDFGVLTVEGDSSLVIKLDAEVRLDCDAKEAA